jgi:hypothetical protein
VAERLFLFVQMEFPWELGPTDGRYLLRESSRGEPERVVVLDTVGAARRGRSARRPRRPQATAEPAPVPTTRATVIDSTPVAAESRAQAWLAGLDAEREMLAAAATLNRMLFAHRISAADPYTRDVSPTQALIVRAGWGEGEDVAYGNWLQARELQWSERGRQRRMAALRPQERLAVLLGARGEALMCEELTLRARLDLDAGRLAHAALQLEQAYAAALVELPRMRSPAISGRIEELVQLRGEVIQAAQAALGDAAGDVTGHGPATDPTAATDTETLGATETLSAAATVEEQVLRHALGRLEAALRALAAAGFGTQ